MCPKLKIHPPEEEIAYMRETLGIREPADLLDRVIRYFDVLQARSAMLLSLISLCLTISGFSGHRIAAAGTLPSVLLAVGMGLALLSAILLLTGPMQLRWATRRSCAEGLIPPCVNSCACATAAPAATTSPPFCSSSASAPTSPP